MYRKHRGFTLVEIAIVVVVVSLLSSITVVAFTKVQSSARDNARESGAIAIADSLEKYYETNGEYPGCTAITGSASSVVPSVLAGVSASTLRTPLAPANDDNSITCGDSTITTQDIFAYVGDSTGACTSGAACLEFRLRWRQESDGVIREIKGLHQTSVATSGSLSVTASATGVTTGSASWNAISNSTGYMVQLSRNSDFTDIVSDLTVAGLSTTFSGLSQDTQYYVRVAALALSSQGDWSNTASFRTVAVPVPTLTTTAQSSTSIGLSWTTVPSAQSYTLQSSLNNTTWTTLQNSLSTTYTHSGIAQGKRMYYRVQATIGGISSNWTIQNAVTTIDAPAPFTVGRYYDSGTYLYLLLADSYATCPAGTSPTYHWYYVRNGSQWLWHTGGDGVSFKATTINLSWNDTVSLTNATQCYTADARSEFTWATNAAGRYMPWAAPAIIVGGATSSYPYWRGYKMYGTCPEFTQTYQFKVYVKTPSINDQRASPVYTYDAAANNSYNTGFTWWNTSIAWGDGGALGQIVCNGPWGTNTMMADVRTIIGQNCFVNPSYNSGQCYWPAGWAW